MLLKEIVRELNMRGYKSEIKVLNKNGYDKLGIMMTTVDGCAYPIISVDDWLTRLVEGELCVEEVIDLIIEKYESEKEYSDINYIKNPEWLCQHVQIAMQRIIDEKDVIKKTSEKFEGLEEYLIVIYDNEKDNQISSFKLPYTLVNNLGIDVDAIWMDALNNTVEHSKMESILYALSGIDDNQPPFILTNREKLKGSGAILNDDLLREFSKKFECEKIVCIPSSIHEWLLIPFTQGEDLDIFDCMVKEVNDQCVDDIDILADHAFLITVE